CADATNPSRQAQATVQRTPVALSVPSALRARTSETTEQFGHAHLLVTFNNIVGAMDVKCQLPLVIERGACRVSRPPEQVTSKRDLRWNDQRVPCAPT